MVDKKQIDALIPAAVQAIENCILSNGEVSSVYRNYLASFGTVARFSGIKTAVAVYSKDEVKTKEDRGQVINMICMVLKIKKSAEESRRNNESGQPFGTELLEYIEKDEKSAKDRIIEAAIAIKTALNLFKQVDKADE